LSLGVSEKEEGICRSAFPERKTEGYFRGSEEGSQTEEGEEDESFGRLEELEEEEDVGGDAGGPRGGVGEVHAPLRTRAATPVANQVSR
jgi:hypothetical protein